MPTERVEFEGLQDQDSARDKKGEKENRIYRRTDDNQTSNEREGVGRKRGKKKEGERDR